MGINDRDYVREEEKGFNLGGIHWSGVGIVITINVVIYLIDMMMEWKLQDFAMLKNVEYLRSGNSVIEVGNVLMRRPWNIWQLFTYGWLHDATSIGHLLFNMIGIWVFGVHVENVMGKKRFLEFYCSSIVLAGISYVIAQQPWFPMHQAYKNCVGASGGVMALVAFAAWQSPYRIFNIYGILPLPLWLIAVIYIVGDLSGYMRPTDNIGHSAHIGGALAGTLFYHTHWCLFDLVPSRLLSWTSRKMKIRKRGFKVHQPTDDDDLDSPVEQSMSARVDGILEKMSRVGEEGLTQEERDYLASASRKLRARRGK